ncbi:CHAT domain-containing tetratricopeptide repeat protein [Bernardetia sp. Wsw4-3y2]|uniref:CHAT domain-containing tetratricopeptide repeat protein n=1 Tax=Bernardetia sp. Wsw4-3y2 TaxID=3127471 RepID=UPI0030D097E6
MSKNNILLFIFFLLFTLQPTFGFAQENGAERQLQRNLEICERYFEDGDYKKALSEAEKLYKKTQRRGNIDLSTKIEKYLIKYYEATGEISKFHAITQKFIANRKKQGENSKGYGLALLQAAKYYAEYSFTQQAENYLNDAKKIVGEKPTENYIFSDLYYTQILIDFQRGNFLNLLDYQIQDLLSVRKSLIGKETQFFSDVSKQTETRNLSDREEIRKKTDYAQILSLQADAARLAGRYTEASKYIEQADNFIKTELSTRQLAYVRNQYVRIQLMIDNGEERDEIRKLLEKILYRAERTVGTVHKDYIKLHALLIDYYVNSGFVVQQDEESKGFSLKPRFLQNIKYSTQNVRQRWELERNAAKYYGTGHLQYSTALQADAMWNYENQRYSQSLKMLIDMYKNTALVPKDHQRRLAIIEDIYYVRLAADDYKEAGKLMEEWVDSHARIHGKNTLGYHLANLKLAKYYFNYTEKFKEAGQLYNTHMQSLTKFVEPKSLIYINSLNDWIDYYMANDQFEEANKKSKEALDLIQQRYGDKHPRYAAQLEIAARLNMQQSNYKKVDTQVSQMLQIYEKQYNPSLAFEHAQALETAAHYYMIMGLYDRAEDLLNQAKRRFNRSSQSIANSSTAEELAFLYIETADFSAAEQLLKETIAEKEKRYGTDSRFLINTYNQSAHLEFANGKYIEAEQFANKALLIAQNIFGQNSIRTVESLSILADYNLAIGDYEKAQEFAQKALKIKTDILGNEHLDRASTLIQLARINFYSTADWKKVANELDEADKMLIANLGENTPVYAGFLKTSAELYVAHKDIKSASDKLGKALNILEKLPSASLVSLAEINVLLGDLQIQQDNPDKAKDFYEDARKKYAKVFSEVHPKYVHVLARIARMYYVKNDYKKAEKYLSEVLDKHKEYINTTFAVLSEREKAKNWEQIRPDFEFFTHLVIQLQPKKKKLLRDLYDNILLTKGILLGQSQKLRNEIYKRSPDDTLRINFEKWQLKKIRLNAALALNPEQLKQENIDVRNLQKEIEDLSKILSRQSSDFAAATAQKPISWKDIQKNLENKEYAVEIIRYRQFDKEFTDSIQYIALVLPSSGNIRLAQMPNGNKMEDGDLQYYRNTVEFSLEDYDSYKIYWKPIGDKIDKNAGKIYLACDGVYNQLNVETFRMEENDFVIDNYFVAQLTSTRQIVEEEVKNVFPNNFVLFGNPLFYVDYKGAQSFPTLLGAEREVEIISTQLEGGNKNVTTYLKENAKEKQIKELNSQNNTVYHIATHGIFKEDISEQERERSAILGTYNDPLMRSGLLFTGGGDMVQNKSVHEYNKADGVLTASEVATMNINSPLFILSACETGRGESKVGEGVYGLQSAFLLAGADALLMSLFKVDDDATQELMRIFYTRWKETGDKRVAIREAKRELRQNPKYVDPIYWGAFVMIGR